MKCPKCKDSKLITKKVKGQSFQIDICPDCRGMWFDENELASLLKVPAKDVKVPPGAQGQDIYCPKCEKPLYVFCYPQTMVLIDMCKECEGIWLDAKEFQEIQSVRNALKKPEPPKKKMTCPKCGHEQNEAVECVRCGVIVSKFYEIKKEKDRKTVEAPKKQDKYEDIPGIKGALLNFIEKQIDLFKFY
jgi:Zn-finger nucleic acid-binding protein